MAFRVEKPNPDAILRLHVEKGWRRSRVQIMVTDELSHVPRKIIDIFKKEGNGFHGIWLEGDSSPRKIVMWNPLNVFEITLHHGGGVDPYRIVFQKVLEALGKKVTVTNPVKGLEIRRTSEGHIIELYHDASFFLPEEKGFEVLVRRQGSTTIKVSSSEMDDVANVLARILSARRTGLNEVPAYALM